MEGPGKQSSGKSSVKGDGPYKDEERGLDQQQISKKYKIKFTLKETFGVTVVVFYLIQVESVISLEDLRQKFPKKDKNP